MFHSFDLFCAEPALVIALDSYSLQMCSVGMFHRSRLFKVLDIVQNVHNSQHVEQLLVASRPVATSVATSQCMKHRESIRISHLYINQNDRE